MKTQFLGGAYTVRSLPLAAQTLINLYPELNESGDGEVGAFYNTPGLVLKAQMASGEGRGLHASEDGFLYAVVGTNVYQINASFTATLIGQLTSGSGTVSILNNETQTLFSHSAGWHYTTGGGTLTEISGAPTDAVVSYLDGYALFTLGGQQFGITAINDVTSIDPLDVAAAEAAPDFLISLYSDQREVWMLCTTTTEIWADTGAESFPFERIPGGVLSIGCAARFSVTYLDGSLFWLAAEKTGNATIIKTVGYQVEKISTHAIEHAIEGYSRIDDAIGFGYQEEGHDFYQLTFPTADATWVYDTSTKLWHQRGYRDSNGVIHRHRASAYAFFAGQHVLLDQSSGALYSYSLDTFTDNGAPIYRERAWPLVAAQEMRRMRLDRLELMGEMGVGAVTGTDMLPQVWLQMSYDGGQSFGYERYQNMGAIGKRAARAVWRRGGCGRRPVAKLATTSTRKVSWVGVNLDGEVLSQ